MYCIPSSIIWELPGVPAFRRPGSIRPGGTHRALRLGHPVTIPHAQEGQGPSQAPDNRSPSPPPSAVGRAATHTAKIGVARIFPVKSPFLFACLAVSFRLSMPGLPPSSTGARASDRVTR
jgi:hypothetical protein